MTEDDVIKLVRAHMESNGYRFERSESATEIVEQVVRPDGSVAVTAKKFKEPVQN